MLTVNTSDDRVSDRTVAPIATIKGSCPMMPTRVTAGDDLEIYNLPEDPQETHNLAQDAKPSIRRTYLTNIIIRIVNGYPNSCLNELLPGGPTPPRKSTCAGNSRSEPQDGALRLDPRPGDPADQARRRDTDRR